MRKKAVYMLDFLDKTALNWNSFLYHWKKYRAAHGTNLDLFAAKRIDEHCQNWAVREFAEQALLQRVKKYPKDWRAIVGLANLLQREGLDRSRKEIPLDIHSDPLGSEPTMPTSKSLYKQAIKLSDGNRAIISRIVYMRIQSAQFISNERGWWNAMEFYEHCLPDDYKKFYRFHTTGYYRIHKNWAKFIHYADAYSRQLGGFRKIHKVNAHLFSLYADNILKYSNAIDQIKTAIDWMNGLIKNNSTSSELPHFKHIRERLKRKLNKL